MRTTTSGGPISVAENWSAAELLRAGWSQADIDWESTSAQMIERLQAGNLDAARELAAKALQDARHQFSGDDPRLATAIANFAGCLEAGGDKSAAALRAEAGKIWQDCGPWIAKMTAPRSAKSSLFHMRMEQRHRGTYEERWRQKWQEYAEEARQRMDRLAAGADDVEPAAIADRWKRECPAMLNDTRKLIAAAVLIAPTQSRRGG